MRAWIRAYMQNYDAGLYTWNLVPKKYIRMACNGTEMRQVLAASIQAEFEEISLNLVSTALEFVNAQQDVEGIVLVGGCALNVLANQRIRENLTMASMAAPSEDMSRRPLDVFVPPGPGDDGLAVGALWAVDPPRGPQPLQYLGFRLWDNHILDY